jgi:hypothetical protein
VSVQSLGPLTPRALADVRPCINWSARPRVETAVGAGQRLLLAALVATGPRLRTLGLDFSLWAATDVAEILRACSGLTVRSRSRTEW